MKVANIFLVTMILTLYCSVAISSDSVYAETPIEKGDVTTIDGMNKGDSDVFQEKPAEQEDVTNIDQINKDDSDAFKVTPAEQDDIKTIEQLNNER